MFERSARSRIASLVLTLFLLLGTAGVMPAYALGVIVVNSSTDTTANDGVCTLREAIIAANTDTITGLAVGECAAGSGVDLIKFDSGLSGATILLSSALPAFSADVFVDGSALASRVTIDGANSYQIFQIGSGVNVYLDSLIIAHGFSSGSGGGIFNSGGIISITDSIFEGNQAGGSGGAIAITSGSTGTITNSTFSDNSAYSWGGAILNMNILVVTNSAFIDNFTAGVGSGPGGAIGNLSGTSTVTNSTFSSNSAVNNGGAIAIAAGSMTVINSTLSGNTAVFGGGIYISNGSLNFSNTIIANSTSNSDCVNDFGTIGTNTNNLVEDNTCSPALSGDPKLAPLGNYDGPTQTFALRSGSPAIDAGDSGSCPPADQRGVTRPIDGNGDTVAACDIGATEYEGYSMTLFTSEAAYDGWILESSENKNSGGSKNNTDTILRLGDNAKDRQYKSMLSFNTASLPDTASIKRVFIFLEQSSVTGTNPFGTHGTFLADIRKPNFGKGAALGLDDFKATANRTQACTFGLDPSPNWYSGSCLTTAFPFVNLTGRTQLRLYFSLDDDDNVTADILNLFSGNALNAADRPYIEVYYTP